MRTVSASLASDSSYSKISSILSYTVFHWPKKSTCIGQIEGALVFAPVVPQEDLINAHVTLGDLEIQCESNFSVTETATDWLPLLTIGGIHH